MSTKDMEVAEHFGNSISGSDRRKLVYTEVTENRKVDAVRANQLEKLGGEVGKIIRYAREISQSPKLSIKEIK